MNKDTERNPSQKDESEVTSEWVGGRLTSPFYIIEDGPHRPEMDLCLELPEGIVVGFDVLDPSGPGQSFAETLKKIMESPMAGPPRRPDRIRVADDQLADEIREAMPDMDVDVAPTPELDEIIMHMKNNLPEEDPAGMSYFEGGAIYPDTIGFLFKAAELLYNTAPWKSVYDSDVFRLDIPELGVEGACLSVIGAVEDIPGFMIFPSYRGYQNFRNLAKEGIPPSGPVNMGTELLSLNYERGADLPEAMRKEAARHNWPVAGPDAYPHVTNLESDCMHRPLTENDILIVSHCALSLTSFFVKHRNFFEREEIEPICESYFDENDLEVRFTFPYQ
jgi:hypothetical protein